MLVAAFFGRTYCGYKPILANNRLQEMCQWQLMLLFLGALMIRVQVRFLCSFHIFTFVL